MKIELFTTDDVKLGYIDKGNGIPVILLAGYSAPATSWFPQENPENIMNPGKMRPLL
jgi:hypothetical protein